MSKAKLKKVLQSLEKEEIINTIIELYDSRKEAKEYLEYWLDPDPQKELEKCQKLVERQFVSPQGVNKRSPQLSVVNRILKDFMSICFEPEKVAELMLCICETEVEWVSVKYRRAEYRNAVKKSYDTLVQYVETHELGSIFDIRIERLKERIDSMEEYYENRKPARGLFRRRGYW